MYYTVAWLWRIIPGLVLRLSAIEAGAYAALITAVMYSAMAGFSIPTRKRTLSHVECIYFCIVIQNKDTCLARLVTRLIVSVNE